MCIFNKKNMNTTIEYQDVERQIRAKQHTVDYDVKEYPVEVIVDKYLKGLEDDENEIFVPSYQRAFVWDNDRQSKFIESLILGLPIPYIFTAEDEEGRLEIVDGSQRIRTLANFMSDKLVLKNLEILTSSNNLKYSDFSKGRQRKFKNSSLRMIVLSEKSDNDTRFMLFERINTGSDLLNNMEKRRGIYQGEFTKFLDEINELPLFRQTTKFTDKSEKRGEPQELLLRFFAYSDNYLNYTGNVNKFMNDYVEDMNSNGFNKEVYISRLNKVLSFVNSYFPNGFIQETHHNYTSRGRFEALSVGVYLALEVNEELSVDNITWLNSKEFLDKISGGGTNTTKNLRGRIEYVRDKLLNNG